MDELLNLPFYAAEGTVFHKAFHSAADVALGKAAGLHVDTYDLGFMADVKNSLFTAQQTPPSKL